MIERIIHQDRTLALVMRAEYQTEGANFITPDDSPLQVGALIHKQGVILKPHVHKNTQRVVTGVHEVLHIVYGEVAAWFFDEKREKVQSTVLKTGDTILLMSGGHGFEMLRDTKMIEVKQGPYQGAQADKERFGRSGDERGIS